MGPVSSNTKNFLDINNPNFYLPILKILVAELESIKRLVNTHSLSQQCCINSVINKVLCQVSDGFEHIIDIIDEIIINYEHNLYVSTKRSQTRFFTTF
jgi:hypothetical protein